MARSPATLDTFGAIADTRRRAILSTLATTGPLPVNDLVASLGWPQPTVSKHLAVLRSAGLVGVRRLGRQRVYRLNAENLRPVHEWASFFEKFWMGQLLRIKELAESDAQINTPVPPPAPPAPPLKINPEPSNANPHL